MTDLAKDVNSAAAEELSKPTTIGVEAYISESYARAERDKLWRKVWQQVGRVEEIPRSAVTSPTTFSMIRSSSCAPATPKIRAYYNVCTHRGRRLVDTPKGAKNACGRDRKSFVCGFHGWTYDLEGRAPTFAKKRTGRVR